MEDIIKEEYKFINSELDIIVTANYYIVIGNISRSEINRVGAAIAQHSEMWDYLVRGKINRLFKQVSSQRRKMDILNLLNLYYTKEGGKHEACNKE